MLKPELFSKISEALLLPDLVAEEQNDSSDSSDKDKTNLFRNE